MIQKMQVEPSNIARLFEVSRGLWYVFSSEGNVIGCSPYPDQWTAISNTPYFNYQVRTFDELERDYRNDDLNDLRWDGNWVI